MIGFLCDRCGHCCRRIGKHELYQSLDQGNGICQYLDQETNFCTIYSERPDICRIDVMYERHFSAIYSREQFYAINRTICLTWQNNCSEENGELSNIPKYCEYVPKKVESFSGDSRIVWYSYAAASVNTGDSFFVSESWGVCRRSSRISRSSVSLASSLHRCSYPIIRRKCFSVSR